MAVLGIDLPMIDLAVDGGVSAINDRRGCRRCRYRPMIPAKDINNNWIETVIMPCSYDYVPAASIKRR